jgi:hypothetical protein
MKDPFDIHSMGDVPDPLAAIDEWPMPPRRAGALAESPTRGHVSAARAFALGAALLYEVAWVFIMTKRHDLPTMSRAVLAIELVIPLVAALFALAAATAPDARGLGAPKGRTMVLALLAPAIFIGATLLVSPADVDTEPFVAHAFRCFVWTAVYSAGPMVLAMWAFRRAFVAAAGWRSAALGMACGAIGALTMSLVCSVGSPAHVLVGHGGMMLVGAVVGALLGRRVGRA